MTFVSCIILLTFPALKFNMLIVSFLLTQFALTFGQVVEALTKGNLISCLLCNQNAKRGLSMTFFVTKFPGKRKSKKREKIKDHAAAISSWANKM